MQAWEGPGRVNGLTVQHLRDWLSLDLKGPGSKKKPNGGPPRWKTGAAAIGAARLVRTHRVELRRLLHLDKPIEEVPTLEEKYAEAQTILKRIPTLILERDNARAAHRMAAGRNKKIVAAKADVRKDEREKAKDMQEELRTKLVTERREKFATEVATAKAKVTETVMQRLERENGKKKSDRNTSIDSQSHSAFR